MTPARSALDTSAGGGNHFSLPLPASPADPLAQALLAVNLRSGRADVADPGTADAGIVFTGRRQA